MEMYKQRAIDILHRSLISILAVFRHFRAFVLTGFENFEEKLEHAALPTAPHLKGKIVMVTGAGGYIGSEIVRQLIQFQPARVLLLGHGPRSIYSIEHQLTKLQERHTDIMPIIMNVQDRKRIFDIIGQHKPDIIYHTTGFQQIDFTEERSSEALYADVFGIKNLAEAASRHQIKNFVLISAEHAAKPKNLMEAAKRLAEMIVESVSLTSWTQYTIIRLPENALVAQKPKKSNLLNNKKTAVVYAAQQVLQGQNHEAAASKSGRFQKKDIIDSDANMQKPAGLSQIEMARILKQLKAATENEARQLVISILKR